MSMNEPADVLAKYEDHFANLETMITYQDQQIETLTNNYNEQQKQLFGMEKELKLMKDIIRNLQAALQGSGVRNISEETPPPHY